MPSNCNFRYYVLFYSHQNFKEYLSIFVLHHTDFSPFSKVNNFQLLIAFTNRFVGSIQSSHFTRLYIFLMELSRNNQIVSSQLCYEDTNKPLQLIYSIGSQVSQVTVIQKHSQRCIEPLYQILLLLIHLVSIYSNFYFYYYFCILEGL